MKKLLAKDKKLRTQLSSTDKQHFILKSIVKNLNLFTLVRWNAFLKLKSLTQQQSKISTTNRCILSVNKKRFNKLTGFSRQIFLKTVRSGDVSGVRKSVW